MIRNWLRILYIKVAPWNSNQWSVFGKTMDDSKKPKIEISGNKYLSPIKDNFSVKIYNLPYSEIALIQMQKKFHIQIFAGYLGDQNYESFEGKKIFDGGIINIVNEKRNYKDNVVTFICANQLVARAQEWRCNISFNSGINMYSAIKYISKLAGLTNINISDYYKNKYLTEASSAKGTAASYLDKISSTDNTFFMNGDPSDGGQVNFYSSIRGGMKKIMIDPNKGMMVGNAPELTSNGLNWISLPVYNYSPGDLCCIDNSYINTSSGMDSFSGTLKTPNTVYLNQEGLYYIFDLAYSLSNINGDFAIAIHAKSKDLFDNVTGYTGAASNG